MREGPTRSKRKEGIHSLPLGRSDNFDLHRSWSEGGNLLLHSVGDSSVHRSSSRHDDVPVELSSDI